MKRALVMAAVLAMACGGQDMHSPVADSTRALGATSREWTRSLVGSDFNDVVVYFATPEPDSSYALAVAYPDHSDGAPATSMEICHQQQWDWGFAVTFCYTPGGPSEWVTYQITADGLRNGG